MDTACVSRIPLEEDVVSLFRLYDLEVYSSVEAPQPLIETLQGMGYKIIFVDNDCPDLVAARRADAFIMFYGGNPQACNDIYNTPAFPSRNFLGFSSSAQFLEKGVPVIDELFENFGRRDRRGAEDSIYFGGKKIG